MRTVAVGVVLVVLSAAGCTSAASPEGAVTVTVTSAGCTVSPATAASGTVEFTVVNASEEVAAFRVLSSGASLGGIGNIAPGISRDVPLELASGSYLAECTAGPTAPGVTTGFTVTDSGTPVAEAKSDAGVSEAYAAWVGDTIAELRDATEALATAFVGGAPDAQDAYREARSHWASLLPAVRQFPELLPAIDARESDLVTGERLSGWHAVEKDLWPPLDYEPLDPEARAELMAALQANLADLFDRIEAAPAMGAESIVRGAQELVDAASRSLGDGDEQWSHAERWLVQGDLDGARAAVDAVRTMLSDDELAVIDLRASSVQDGLDDNVTERELTTRIDALATALSMISLETGRIDP